MGKRRTPTAGLQMQASAVCPKCKNIVWSDGLSFSDHFIDALGNERPGKLVIDCESCGKKTKVPYQH